MKLATIFLCALVLAVSVSSYDLSPRQARKMRAQCLNECKADCPKNSIKIMESNCKSICKKGEPKYDCQYFIEKKRKTV